MSRRLISLLLVLVLAASIVAFGSVSASAATGATITVAGKNYTANVGDVLTYKLSFTYPTAKLATYQIELPVNFTILSGPSQEELDNIFGEIPDIGYYRYDTANTNGVVGYVENYISFSGRDCSQTFVVMELYFKVIKAGSTSLYANLRDVSDVEDNDVVNYKGTVLDTNFTYTESLTVTSGTVTLSGNAQTYLNTTDTVTVKLFKSGSTEPVAQVTGTGKSTPYSFDVSQFTDYTLTVEKLNHVTRSFDVRINDVNVTKDLKINPLGDTNLNGVVDIKDVNALYKHVMETKKITDEYALDCSDVAKKFGEIVIKDVNALYKHVMETKPLY